MYDHAKPWVTHASVQGDEWEKIADWRAAFGKPIVFDECKYEGNIPRRWGDISAQEMVHRVWLGTMMGAWVGHGETYLDPQDILWWSKGGVLRGESPARIGFLRKILEAAPRSLNPLPNAYYPALARDGEYYLHYLDYHRPAELNLDLPSNAIFRAEWIDPWEMTVTPIEGRLSGKQTLRLPGRPYLAVRLQKVS